MDLRNEILARADCASFVEARDIDAIAALVSVDRKAVQTRFANARTVLAECGLLGPEILDALQVAAAAPGKSAVKWALAFISQEAGLDVGHPATRYMVQQLIDDKSLSPEQGAALLNLANLPAPVSRNDVADALFNPDGTAK